MPYPVGRRLSRSRPGWTGWCARIESSGVEQAICFGHGHSLRALTMRWLGFPIELGIHFPLDTSTISVLGHEKGQPALDRWNARP